MWIIHLMIMATAAATELALACAAASGSGTMHSSSWALSRRSSSPTLPRQDDERALWHKTCTAAKVLELQMKFEQKHGILVSANRRKDMYLNIWHSRHTHTSRQAELLLGLAQLDVSSSHASSTASPAARMLPKATCRVHHTHISILIACRFTYQRQMSGQAKYLNTLY